MTDQRRIGHTVGPADSSAGAEAPRRDGVGPTAPPRIPHIVHFVFGMRPQTEPFHLLHYIALASCARVLAPDRIYLHYHHLPFGYYWDLIRPAVTLVRVEPASEVESADYARGLVPERYRYAHHADVVRLDALLEHGGIYADIDTIFLRPLPDAYYTYPFVIAEEGRVRDEVTGQSKPSLCNAFMMSRCGSSFAAAWRRRLGEALNGTWSNHSGFLAQRLSEEQPDEVHVAPARAFFPVLCTPGEVTRLLESPDLDLSQSYSIHLWAHVWWEKARRDFSKVHAGMFSPDHIRGAETSLARVLRPYLEDLEAW